MLKKTKRTTEITNNPGGRRKPKPAPAPQTEKPLMPQFMPKDADGKPKKKVVKKALPFKKKGAM